jgi:L-lactate dehydrogenase
MTPRFSAPDLVAYAEALLGGAGLERAKAAAVAEVLVEGDLLGHTTHGLQLLAAYLAEIEKGAMTKDGEPAVLADFPAAVTWDGRRLPGPWLVMRALAVASERARRNGVCTVVIRRSHHLACLAAYLRPIAEQGLLAMLTCSDPAIGGVAPHGGRRSVYTPDPIAAAWPTDGDPVMLDVSMSITTNGLTKRLQAEGRRFPGPWAVDGEGNPTDDPGALAGKNPGALLPMGGADHGHKGFALGLLVEALTGGLAGHGRADPPEGWSANVFILVCDPALFGGREDFIRQTSWLADACRATPARPGFDRVRLPGENGLKRRSEQLARGVELYPGIREALAPWARKFGIAEPPCRASDSSL